MSDIKKEIMDVKESILDVDFDLAMMEDYMHGEEGKKITSSRGSLQSIIKKLNDIILKLDVALKVTE